jgi:hypothetical protein
VGVGWGSRRRAVDEKVAICGGLLLVPCKDSSYREPAMLRTTPLRTARSRVRTFSNYAAVRSWAPSTTTRPSLAGLPIDVAPEVAQAQADGKPIVALESTLITHGESLSCCRKWGGYLNKRARKADGKSMHRTSATALTVATSRMRRHPPSAGRHAGNDRDPERPHQGRRRG